MNAYKYIVYRSIMMMNFSNYIQIKFQAQIDITKLSEFTGLPPKPSFPNMQKTCNVGKC